jgi:hypothetical protein
MTHPHYICVFRTLASAFSLSECGEELSFQNNLSGRREKNKSFALRLHFEKYCTTTYRYGLEIRLKQQLNFCKERMGLQGHTSFHQIVDLEADTANFPLSIRKLHEELLCLYSSPNITGIIKAERLKWATGMLCALNTEEMHTQFQL